MYMMKKQCIINYTRDNCAVLAYHSDSNFKEIYSLKHEEDYADEAGHVDKEPLQDDRG